MNICCCINEKFIEPFKVLCYSLIESQEEKIEMYLIYDNMLEEKEIERIQKYLDFLKINFYKIPFPSNIEKRLSSLKKSRGFKTPVNALFRLFIPSLLPEDINRVLYLDSDIVVQKDISEFYHMSFSEKKVIGILDPVNSLNYDTTSRKYIREVLEIIDDQTYINSGVLLLNLKELRKAKSLDSKKIYKTIKEKSLIYADQDIINFLLKDSIYTIKNCDYNAPVGSIEKNEFSNFSILHYLGAGKPWILRENELTAIENYPYIKRVKIVKLIEKHLQRKRIYEYLLYCK